MPILFFIQNPLQESILVVFLNQTTQALSLSYIQVDPSRQHSLFLNVC